MTTETPTKKRPPQGMTPTEARAKITALFDATATGAEFAAALNAAGFQIVKTTRGVLQALDAQGGAHNLKARVAAPVAEVEQRLAEIPAENITPKKTREREARAKMLCTPEEYAEAETRARRAGLSVSGYLRALVFGKDAEQPRAARRPSAEHETLLRLLGELGKIGSNLNQIARALNQGRGFDAPIFAELAAELREATRALMDALGRGKDAP